MSKAIVIPVLIDTLPFHQALTWEKFQAFCTDVLYKIANSIDTQEYLKEKGILQEFLHVATPEDNAFIEALHSNLQREVIDRFEFESLYHAQMIIDRYYKWYNGKRKHGSLQRKTPNAVYDHYFNPNPFEN